MAAPIAAKVAIQVAQSKTARRLVAGIIAAVLMLAALPFVLVGSAAIAIAAGDTKTGSGTCTTPEATEKYSVEQLQNAQTLRTEGVKLGVPDSGVKISIMVALVESDLLNRANSTIPESLELPNQGTPGSDHDSLGIIQQRPSSGWGTVTELMTPAFAARAFFGGPEGPNGGNPPGLLDIDGWEDMPLGVAAQTVQVSAFPDRYQERAADADAVLAAIGGASCDNTGGPPPQVVGGWANPVGMQPWGTYFNHTGGAMDVHVPVGTPVYAPAAGRVFDLSESCGGLIVGVQHDVQYTTAFAHLSAKAVQAGEQVKAGQLIGYSGASGSCVDGAHLHFEVRVGPDPHAWGSFTPAYKFMREQGITMGPCVSGCDLYPM